MTSGVGSVRSSWAPLASFPTALFSALPLLGKEEVEEEGSPP